MKQGPTNWPPQESMDGMNPEDVQDALEEMDSELLPYFRRLPKELWARHYQALEKMADEVGEDTSIADQRKSYMALVLEGREKAIVEFSVSDKQLQKVWKEDASTQEYLSTMLREVFLEQGNFLGAGRTARVKRATVEGIDYPIAIKYLLTPTKQTLSINAEHDMLLEVETITRIEEAENRRGVGSRIGVPHPYFFYKRGGVQCYGMDEVVGIDLDGVHKGVTAKIGLQDVALNALRTRYASEEARQALYQEVDDFVTAMHEVCLHGDIKDKNLMIDAEGKFHLIDFGQSVNMNKEDEKTRDQFENLKDEERRTVLDCVRRMVQFSIAPEREAA